MNETTEHVAENAERRPIAVIAFGGNALLRPKDHGTQEEQFTLAWKATRWLVEIIHRGYELAIVHGNGPQVGNIMIQVEEAITKIPPQSLDLAVAQTQGSMGYMLANQLRNRLHEEQLEKDLERSARSKSASKRQKAEEKARREAGRARWMARMPSRIICLSSNSCLSRALSLPARGKKNRLASKVP